MFTQDFIVNGQGSGVVGQSLQRVGYEPGLMRPYLAEDKNGRTRPFVTINTGQKKFNPQTKIFEPVYKSFPAEDLARRGFAIPTINATSLRKEDWIEIDKVVVRAARLRLRAWMDLEAASSYGGFNGMAKMTHEYEAMSDVGEAMVDMDGLADGRTDSPLYKLRSVPLAITHSDFYFSERRIAVSRNSSTPLDLSTAEMAGRRVGEMIEQTLIGTQTGITYGTQASGITAHDGTSTVYGYTNFPYRITGSVTTPDGTNPQAVLANVISMREAMYSNGFYGPFVLYNSSSYDQWLDNDYFRSGSTAIQRTLRERLKSIDGISDVRRLDYLTSGYQLILVQMTPEVIQAINAMEITTVQWDSQGGLRKNFKVMCIKVPLLKAPYNGIAAIAHWS